MNKKIYLSPSISSELFVLHTGIMETSPFNNAVDGIEAYSVNDGFTSNRDTDWDVQ